MDSPFLRSGILTKLPIYATVSRGTNSLLSDKIMNAKEQYFTWADCWVITGILWSIPTEAEIDLSTLIGTGDMLNHAIYTDSELKSGFFKAQKRGLISVKENKISISKSGQEIRTKVQNMRGGLFSIVNNMQKKLNSKRTKLPDVPDDAIDPCNFINEINLREGHQRYSNNFNKSR